MLVPTAVLAIVSPAYGTVYLSIEQAQALMFPGASFTPDFRELAPEQIDSIQKLSGTKVLSRELRLWQVSTGGWFIVDEVVGKHEFIPYALGLDGNGTVKGLEILEYRESQGGQIRNPAWRKQFAGKRHGAALSLARDVRNISGATLSCRHVTEGVKRLLATYAIAVTQD
jgi:FMN-binding domain